MTILLLEPIHADAQQLLAAYDETVLAPDGNHPAAIDARTPIRAVLTRGRGRISASLMADFPNLRVVARCGVGLDNIDTAAAHKRGIAVVYAPGSTTTAVAEHTLLLMLAAARRIQPIANAVTAGDWAVRDSYQGSELAGKTLGVIGLGAIGRRVAELATAFGMHVVSWSRASYDSRYPARPFRELLATADIVSLHIALTPETRHLIGATELALMQPGALLINTARGGLIDQQALADALEQRRLGAFATDVLDPEPPAASERLLHSENVLITPHIAALTDTTYRAMCVRTATNVLAILRGEQPEAAALYATKATEA